MKNIIIFGMNGFAEIVYTYFKHGVGAVILSDRKKVYASRSILKLDITSDMLKNL